MIVKILGVLDLLAALIFWLFGFFHIIPVSIVAIFAFYLLIKGIIFIAFSDVASILDVAVALLMFLALTISLPKIIIFLIAGYLIQKGVFSLL